ncbi:hypothetical protein ACUXQ2_006253 [Cupriavidus metallidurans]|uniref:hypothetical protein n=1 Tax=Cupriavidus metallidurans TaxID=119219 RepID=UPI00056180AF|nr:hypothetical protein [Cupriavidus metallidurans]HBD37910.1 hypothetical protein [Cupriavidus sp.]
MSNSMNLPKIARRTDVFELRNAVRAVIGSCKATNKAAVLAVDAAEEAFQASITDDEKAYIVSAARGWKAAWHKSRPDDPFLRGVEFNAYDDVRHHLGMSMVVKFLQDAQSESLAEPDISRIAGLVLEGGDESVLDSVVHDECSAHATGINNDGTEAQVAFLLANGWTEEAIRKEAGVDQAPRSSSQT